MSRRYNAVVPTAYGMMIVNRNDWQDRPYGRIGVGYELMESGQYQHEEMEFLGQLARRVGPDPVVLDVGANIGVAALVFSAAVGERGRVLAFEPQRILFQMLMGNLALNSVENVFAYHMALGREVSEIALPPVDYRRNWSFGGLGLGRPSPDPQFPGTEASALASLPAETVALRTIDSLSLPRADLIKLDVEGMEEDVLRGAEATIRRQRPIVFVEWLKRDGGSLPRYVGTMNYRLLQAGWNLLCVPEERADGFPVAGVTELKLETLD